MTDYTSPHWDRAAAITIDTQCDTLDGQPFEIAGTTAALPAMAQALAAFRAAGRPIVHIVRLYRPDGANVDLCRRAAVQGGASLLLAGGPGSQLAAELGPGPLSLQPELLLAGGVQQVGPREVVIYKPRWGAFYQTPLEEHLRSLGVDTLVFMGCNFPNCPRTSIYEASERDYRLVLVEDAISGLYPQGRQELMNIGVTMLSVRQVAAALAA